MNYFQVEVDVDVKTVHKEILVIFSSIFISKSIFKIVVEFEKVFEIKLKPKSNYKVIQKKEETNDIPNRNNNEILIY